MLLQGLSSEEEAAWAGPITVRPMEIMCPFINVKLAVR